MGSVTVGGRTALVTGANRGIGLEVARGLARLGLAVVAGARDPDQGAAAATLLDAEGLDVRFILLDVADPAATGRAAAELARVDVLVNNAGVYTAGSAVDVEEDAIRDALEVNLLGPWRLCRAVVPHMLRRGWGRIVNVSSEGGSLTSMTTGRAPYRVSKAGLNALTRTLALELAGTGVLINAVCPGWVATDMGGPAATRTVEQGAESVLWAVTLPDDGPTGGFFRDGRPVPW